MAGKDRPQSFRGVYTTERAAALAGVPVSTVYYWAREKIYTPSVSQARVKLWSWPDLLALRAIYWLRSSKPDVLGRATMRTVRQLLRVVEKQIGGRLGDELAHKRLILSTDEQGQPFVTVEEMLSKVVAADALQSASRDVMVDLLAEFESESQLLGPHLVVPRPRLRIIPGKLGGEPHVHDTRLESRTISELLVRGLSGDQIVQLYPFLNRDDVEQSKDLEMQLRRNISAVAA